MYYDTGSIFASFGTISFLIGIFALIVNYILACAFQEVAEEKGFTDRKYFWYCFWLGIFGCILVAALPDKYARPVVSQGTREEQKQIDEIEEVLKF